MEKAKLIFMDVTLNCMVCGIEFQGPEPTMCCDGTMCGCLGMPIDPIICSEQCYNNLPFRKPSEPVLTPLDLKPKQ